MKKDALSCVLYYFQPVYCDIFSRCSEYVFSLRIVNVFSLRIVNDFSLCIVYVFGLCTVYVFSLCYVCECTQPNESVEYLTGKC